MYEYDSKLVYISLPDAQKFLSMPGEVTGIELKLADPDRTEPVLGEIARSSARGYEVQDWKELNRSLFSALKLEKIAMFVVLRFIVLVASFSIVANRIMLVTREGQGGGDPEVDGRARRRDPAASSFCLGLYIGGSALVTGDRRRHHRPAVRWSRYGLPLEHRRLLHHTSCR